MTLVYSSFFIIMIMIINNNKEKFSWRLRDYEMHLISFLITVIFNLTSKIITLLCADPIIFFQVISLVPILDKIAFFFYLMKCLPISNDFIYDFCIVYSWS